MKLDRNINGDGRGKYGLVKNRELKQYEDLALEASSSGRNPNELDIEAMRVVNAINMLVDYGIIDWGATPDTEFFVMRLKDQNADQALLAYAAKAMLTDQEYGADVHELARRSGHYHPHCKKPD